MSSNTVIRLLTYFALTVAISFISQLEALKFDAAAIRDSGLWVIFVKSLLPGLVSLKAFFDNTSADAKPAQEQLDEDKQ